VRDFACVCDAADAMEAKLTEVCGGQHNMVGKDRGQGKWYIYIYSAAYSTLYGIGIGRVCRIEMI